MTFKGTDTVVEYGKNKLTNVTRGNVTVFSSEGHTRFIHRVTLENLEHGQKYCKWDIVQYMCQVVDYWDRKNCDTIKMVIVCKLSDAE